MCTNKTSVELSVTPAKLIGVILAVPTPSWNGQIFGMYKFTLTVTWKLSVNLHFGKKLVTGIWKQEKFRGRDTGESTSSRRGGGWGSSTKEVYIYSLFTLEFCRWAAAGARLLRGYPSNTLSSLTMEFVAELAWTTYQFYIPRPSLVPRQQCLY